MRLTSLKLPQVVVLLLLAVAVVLLPRAVAATQPYNNPGPFVTAWTNPTGVPSLPSPATVSGKEYSSIGAPGSAEQVILWDGFGGVMDGIDYADSARPDYEVVGKVDALAYFEDTLFQETLDDKAHLIFSVSQTASLSPIPLTNHQSIGGAGELSYELAGDYAPPSTMGLWAAATKINAMPEPVDIDAVELWGPEPDLAADAPLIGDSNRYSLENDADSGVSVWLRRKLADDSYSSFPYVPHSMVVAAVVAQLGPAGGFDEEELAPLIDLDALMAYDMPGTSTRAFDGLDPVNGPWDKILFSIRQIADAADPSGYYATGSEILWLDASGASGFLRHGGHDWDKEYALDNLVVNVGNAFAIVDIDALEAVAVIPEPSTTALVSVLAVLLGWRSRRRR